MTIKFIFLIIFSSLSLSSVNAEDAEISAFRDPSLPFEHYEQLMHETELYSQVHRASAIGSAQYYTGENLADATSWPTVEVLQSRFATVRGDRSIRWSRNPEFPRRISWLYPNDGCYVRATMTNRWFKSRGIETPKKVFAFGKLRTKTNNHPRGVASWWYHVAPIVQVNGEKFVLDPSIEAARPLSLRDWLGRMGTPGEIKVAICAAGTHSPRSDCADETVGTSVLSSQQTFLSKEWDQLKRMGKNPEALLGSRPPWLRRVRAGSP